MIILIGDMKMKKLTKKEYENLGFYAGDVNYDVLSNGQTGYYKAKKILVVCCGNCGHYCRIKIKDLIGEFTHV